MNSKLRLNTNCHECDKLTLSKGEKVLSESGRSMLEMLAVLSVLGTMSIFVLKGYRSIVAETKAENTERMMVMIANTYQNPFSKKREFRETVETPHSVFTVETNQNSPYLWLTTSISDEDFCKKLKESRLVQADLIEGTCPGTLTFFLKKERFGKCPKGAVSCDEKGVISGCKDGWELDDGACVCHHGSSQGDPCLDGCTCEGSLECVSDECTCPSLTSCLPDWVDEWGCTVSKQDCTQGLCDTATGKCSSVQPAGKVESNGHWCPAATPDWNGEECVDLCAGKNCSGHGTCSHGVCSCSDNHYGNNCESCDAGYYLDGTECKICAAGTYAAAGANVCSQCPEYRYSSEGSSSCIYCGVDRTNNSDHTGCLCRAGYKGDNTTCTACNIGSYSSEPGSTSCTPCPPGSATPYSASQSCRLCSPGRYSSGIGAFSCQRCQTGKYSSEEGATLCTDCPAGKYSSEVGATSCTDCPAGSYSATGATSCTPCAAGTASSIIGATACTTCSGEREYTDTTGATACSICEPGKKANSTHTGCEACASSQGLGGCGCPSDKVPYTGTCVTPECTKTSDCDTKCVGAEWWGCSGYFCECRYGGECFVGENPIMLANGTCKRADEITYDDELLVWNFDEGKFDSAKPLWIQKALPANLYKIMEFSDGSVMKIINGHRGFNCEAGKFTYLDSDDTPIGTTTMNAKGEFVKLVKKQIVKKDVIYYNIVTNYHLNCFVGNILASCRLNNLYPIKDMKFVKDDRKLVDYKEFSELPRKWYDGLRLAEQSSEINHKGDVVLADSLIGYVQRMISIAK